MGCYKSANVFKLIFFFLIKLPTNVHRIHVKMEGFALTSIWPSRVNVSLDGRGVFARKVRYKLLDSIASTSDALTCIVTSCNKVFESCMQLFI